MWISIHEGAKDAATSAANFIATSLRESVEQRGLASLALSGGSTPKLMYTALSALDLPWHRIHFFQVDERVAPDTDNARNSLHIAQLLINQVDIPGSNWHPLPVNASPLSDAAAQYSDELSNCCQGRLDVVHLGLGDDGHTASWPPGDPVLRSNQLVDIVQNFRGFDRLTLTPQIINDAGVIAWLVVGTDKSQMLHRWQQGDPQLPSSAVRRGDADALFTDVQTTPTGA